MVPIADAIYHSSSDVSAPSLAGSFSSGKDLPSTAFGGSRDDRIRSVFGLRNGGRLPPVNRTTLLAYCKYLRARLSMPFEAEHYSADLGTAHGVRVVDLLLPNQPDVETGRGLMCLARCGDRILRLPLVDLEVSEDDPGFHLIEDYWFWAWNWGIDRSGCPGLAAAEH